MINFNPCQQKISFGTVTCELNNMTKKENEEKEILEALKEKFPKGTKTEVKSLYCGESSEVTIYGPSENAERKIADALKAAALCNVELKPFEITPQQQRINAGLEVLEGPDPGIR